MHFEWEIFHTLCCTHPKKREQAWQATNLSVHFYYRAKIKDRDHLKKLSILYSNICRVYLLCFYSIIRSWGGMTQLTFVIKRKPAMSVFSARNVIFLSGFIANLLSFHRSGPPWRRAHPPSARSFSWDMALAVTEDNRGSIVLHWQLTPT